MGVFTFTHSFVGSDNGKVVHATTRVAQIPPVFFFELKDDKRLSLDCRPPICRASLHPFRVTPSVQVTIRPTSPQSERVDLIVLTDTD